MVRQPSGASAHRATGGPAGFAASSFDVTRLEVRGSPRPLSVFGQRTGLALMLQPDQNQLRVDFVGLGFAPGERLRYQYLLSGADRDWSRPTEDRTVDYASLRPGSYMFQVRALSDEGAVSAEPATVLFTVLPPWWQRWWVRASAGIALGLMIYGLYRYRLAQSLSVECIRIRIATDLHDESARACLRSRCSVK